MAPDMLGTPWKCSHCGTKLGQGQVQDMLRDYESLIRDFRGQDWGPLTTQLRRHLPDNHLFLVCLKEKQLFNRLSADTKTTAGLLKRIGWAEQLIDIVDKIDGGYTTRKGKLFQVLAKDRLCLAKIQLQQQQGAEGGGDDPGEGKKTLQRAAAELKMANLCLKYS